MKRDIQVKKEKYMNKFLSSEKNYRCLLLPLVMKDSGIINMIYLPININNIGSNVAFLQKLLSNVFNLRLLSELN